MVLLAERLAKRFEEQICRVCIHRTADDGCTLTERRNCPVFEWAEQLSELVQRMDSNRVADYLSEIEAIICPQCRQDEQGHCDERAHLDCPLDLYIGLVIEILEEELGKK